MALSENIKARRMALKMSQEYVAEQLGISRQAVGKWETGKSEPTAANLAELAALFEMSVSELVEPENCAGQRVEQERQAKEKRHNAKMLLGRWSGVVLVNASWDGFSSGLYADVPYYWFFLLAAGLVLLFITSIDMEKKHKLKKTQIAVGAGMLFSIFFLPRIIPFGQAGINYLLADVVTAVCVIVLNLKYWRYIWNVK
ncbi:MAG TPA: helix-turn-helix transcriptional regulator [Candidatus Aphodoplasma excrementigallinarum]|uniref:Helix-turn-helix transcriptional regulator n=1 Tax=Candidatus Aphodoplasma excrementigallinarum TaxID=2840673 RepID=A0A9D1NIK2_9FIRM|nr:helix-turn-helix transcriptional regulator [Candidatus Aphodoplasma excrementigallinarum]